MNKPISFMTTVLLAVAIANAEETPDVRKGEVDQSRRTFCEPERMKKARAELHAELTGRFNAEELGRKVRALNVESVKRIVATRKDFDELSHARYWCGANATEIIPWLIAKIDDRSLVGLSNSADLIIWDRVLSEDLKFWGHGGIVNDDLFTVA